MVQSSPCGSERPDNTSTSYANAHPVPELPCNIDARSESNRPGGWHVTCCGKRGKHESWAPLRRGRRLGNSGVREGHMARATLTISSKNYSSWSLRGWLLTKF